MGREREHSTLAGAKRRGAARLAGPRIRPVRGIGTRPEKSAAVRIADLRRLGRLEVPGSQFAALENEGELTPIVDEVLRTLRADPADDKRIEYASHGLELAPGERQIPVVTVAYFDIDESGGAQRGAVLIDLHHVVSDSFEPEEFHHLGRI